MSKAAGRPAEAAAFGAAGRGGTACLAAGRPVASVLQASAATGPLKAGCVWHIHVSGTLAGPEDSCQEPPAQNLPGPAFLPA